MSPARPSEPPTTAVLDVSTPAGMARAHLHLPGPPVPARQPAGLLVLGHGAGGGIGAPDLRGLAALRDDGWAVALVEQPWRVAGRRVATPPRRLDQAWIPAVEATCSALPEATGPLVVGGRSAGARVACRTATLLSRRPAGVLCLAFPLRPPQRPEQTRVAEALGVSAAGIPLAFVQGESDPFGTPALLAAELGAEARAEVFAARGGHSFMGRATDAVQLARAWVLGLAERSQGPRAGREGMAAGD